MSAKKHSNKPYPGRQKSRKEFRREVRGLESKVSAYDSVNSELRKTVRMEYDKTESIRTKATSAVSAMAVLLGRLIVASEGVLQLHATEPLNGSAGGSVLAMLEAAVRDSKRFLDEVAKRGSNG